MDVVLKLFTREVTASPGLRGDQYDVNLSANMCGYSGELCHILSYRSPKSGASSPVSRISVSVSGASSFISGASLGAPLSGMWGSRLAPSRGASDASLRPGSSATPASMALSSFWPMMTFPATNVAAPSHQSGGSASEKMAKPRTAVITKLADVFMIDTCVVELPRARAVVKSVHITPLNARFRPKKV